MVRILKRLRNEMAEQGVSIAKTTPSYLIECLVWNVPGDGFSHDTYRADVRYVLAHVFNQARSDESCSEWGDINELKYLFPAQQPWTRQSAHSFVSGAWDYIATEAQSTTVRLLSTSKAARATKMEGAYWTDRNTRGDMILTERRAEVFDSYSDAAGAFGLTR